MTLIEAPGFCLLTVHELLKLSWSTGMITALVLKDIRLTAVIKSLVQYSKATTRPLMKHAQATSAKIWCLRDICREQSR